jgi:uncharacterized protein YwgA
MKSSTEAIPTPPALLTDKRVIQGSAAIVKYLRSIGKYRSAQNQRVQMTLAVLKCLKVSSSLSTFNDRLRMQKVVFLLQKMGLQTRWNFSWYLRGPYSSDLAHALFENNLQQVSKGEFNRETLRAIERVKSCFKLESMSVADLEAAASILYVADQCKKPWESESQLADETLSKKPMLNRSIVATYVSKLWNEVHHSP